MSSVISQTAIMKTVIIEDKQRIESIILHCDACFVGITDLEGNPYVVPMNFGYENGIIYLHSGPEGSKLEMLEHNNNVCITFSVGHKLVYQHEKVACSYSMRSILSCVITRIVSSTIPILRYVMSKYGKYVSIR